jgi:hypothetical protein
LGAAAELDELSVLLQLPSGQRKERAAELQQAVAVELGKLLARLGVSMPAGAAAGAGAEPAADTAPGAGEKTLSTTSELAVG